MTNTDYTKLEEFLSDTSFCEWAKGSKASSTDFWNKWIACNPTKISLVNEAKDIIIGIQFKEIEKNKEQVEAQWKLFEKRLNQQQQKRKRNNLSKVYMLVGVAASILLLITIGLFTFKTPEQKVIHTAPFGEIVEVKLIDGTKVTLNSNSSLYYYKNETRKVWLQGEAFFQVQKKPTTNAKFSVATNDLVIQVYGTAFNVDTKHQKTAVFLEEGAISLKLSNGNIKSMSPGNFLSYSAEKDAIIDLKKNINSKLKTSWKDGSITFENLPLSEAIKKIEETYGVSAIFKDTISQEKRITGGVPNTNLDICLKAIEKSVGVQIQKTKNTLIIQNKK